MPDARDILAKATGLSRSEMDDIWKEVKANRAKLKSCKVHRFEGGEVKKLGAKYVCLNCGGTEDLTSIGDYIAGYVAAGGDAETVWPGWR